MRHGSEWSWLLFVVSCAWFSVWYILPTLICAESVVRFFTTNTINNLLVILALLLAFGFFIISFEVQLKRWRNLVVTYGISFIMFSFLWLLSLPTALVFPVLWYLLIIVWVAVWWRWNEVGNINNNKVQENRNIKGANPDVAITSINQDILGVKRFIEHLAGSITNLTFEESYVFGLCGEWGQGKTSVLNLMREHFENNEPKEKYIIVNFSPWHYSDEQRIVNAFYKEIRKAASIDSLPLSRLVGKYGRLLLPKSWWCELLFSFLPGEESIKELKDEIGNKLAADGKYLIIIIDDLDRLNPDELLEMLMLVRNNADFNRTRYILSYDPVQIRKILRRNRVSQDFVEKIVQREVKLPEIYKDKIFEVLSIELSRIIDKTKIPDSAMLIITKKWDNIFHHYLAPFITNVRDLKRMSAIIESTLPQLKDEVNIQDMILMLALGYACPQLHEDVWDNPACYVETEWDNANYFRYPGHFDLKKDKKQEAVVEHLKPLFQTISFDKRGSIERLLKELFPKIENALENRQYTKNPNESSIARNDQRIYHPDVFIKYFIFKVPPDHISDAELDALITKWKAIDPNNFDASFSETIEFYSKEKKLCQLFNGIERLHITYSPEFTLRLLNGIYSNVDRYGQKGGDLRWGSEYAAARYLIQQLLEKSEIKPQLEKALEEMINTVAYFPLSVDLISHFCSPTSEMFNQIKTTIDTERLKTLMANRLQKYFIDNNHDLFAEYPESYQWRRIRYCWASNWDTPPSPYNEMVCDYIFNLVQNSANYLIEYVHIFRGRYEDGRLAEYNFESEDRLNEYDKVVAIANETINLPKLTEQGKKEIREFIDAFSEWKKRHIALKSNGQA